MTERERVIERAMECLRTPFHNNQALKGAGMDCLGLLLYAYAEVAPNIVFKPYAAQHMLHQKEEKYLEGLGNYCEEVKAPQRGDIALFKFGYTYSHSAIVIEWPIRAIHCYVGRGVEIVDPSLDSHLGPRFKAAKFYDPWKGKQ